MQPNQLVKSDYRVPKPFGCSHSFSPQFGPSGDLELPGAARAIAHALTGDRLNCMLFELREGVHAQTALFEKPWLFFFRSRNIRR